MTNTNGVSKRELFDKVDSKIMRFFTEHGKKKQSAHHTHPEIVLTGHESYKGLVDIAKTYDIKEFFALKRTIPRSSLRIHYRLVAKTYRTSRDIFLRAEARVRHIIHVLKRAE
jgi:hypothetical protein